MKRLMMSLFAVLAAFAAGAVEYTVTSVDGLKELLGKKSTVAGDVILVPESDEPYAVDETISVSKGVTIRGVKADFTTPADPAKVVFDAAGACRVMGTSAMGVVLENMTIAHGYLNASSSHGAGLNIGGGTLAATNCVFCYCTNACASADGGAVYTTPSQPIMFANCTFTDNYSAYRGGAVYDNKGNSILSFDGCEFYRNTCANGDGGAIVGCLAVVSDCTFVGNTASHEGGAINVVTGKLPDGGHTRISDCVFTGNKSANGGAAIYAVPLIDILDCQFIGNTTDANGLTGTTKVLGGAVHAYTGVGELARTTFSTNAIVNFGGLSKPYGSYLQGGALWGAVSNMVGCSFFGNSGGAQGGAWCATESSSTPFASSAVSGTTFAGNRCVAPISGSPQGGAVWQDSDFAMTFADCTFKDNADHPETLEDKTLSIRSYGGAIYAQGCTRFEDCRFLGNKSLYRGSAIYGSVTGGIVRCTFAGNVAHHPADYDAIDGETGTSASDAAIGTVCLLSVPADGLCTIEDSVFTDNVVFGRSGSAVFQDVGSLKMTGCRIEGNVVTNVAGLAAKHSYGYASAVHFCSEAKDTTLRSDGFFDRCEFRNNLGIGNSAAGGPIRGALQLCAGRYAEGQGGTFHFGGYVRNCLFAGNEARDLKPTPAAASNQGGGLYVSNHPIAVENCTFADNSSDGSENGNAFAAGTNVSFVNDIFAGGDVTGGTQTNNLTDEDPGFTDRAAGDYTIRKSSPAHEAGIELVWHAGALDLAGNPRVTGDKVDIGAYEYCPVPGFMLIFR